MDTITPEPYFDYPAKRGVMELQSSVYCSGVGFIEERDPNSRGSGSARPFDKLRALWGTRIPIREWNCGVDQYCIDTIFVGYDNSLLG